MLFFHSLMKSSIKNRNLRNIWQERFTRQYHLQVNWIMQRSKIAALLYPLNYFIIYNDRVLKIFSSMGAGAKTDPSKIRIDLLSKTKTCPLARNVRRNLRKKSISTDIMCVYSEELPMDPAAETVCGSGDCPCAKDRAKFCADHDEAPIDWCGMKKQINGALVHITGIFGFMLAGLIINDLKARVEAGEQVHQ